MKIISGRPQPFGAEVEGNKVNFAVRVPAGKDCFLLLYKKGTAVPEKRIEMPESEGIGEVRYLAVDEIDPGSYEYNFEIGRKVYVDPYVKELAGKETFGKKRDPQKHEIRGRMIAADYDWKDDRRLHLPWSEVIAYSLHVRGYTKHSSSKVKNKGTFLGLTEKISYLKDLGINQIQCMPVYEFEECRKTGVNYWGYGPAYYFAPKSAYASGTSPAAELKDMVRAFHREQIEVVLEMPFAEGVSVQTVLECLRFYMMEYHVDGFVVNPYIVPWEILREDPFLKDIKLIRKEDGFQNIMRRFLKGDENMVNDVIWALRHNSSADGACNYITTHTGFTLWDLVSYDCKHNEANGENNTDGPDYNYSWNCGAEGPSRKKAVVTLRKNQVRNALFLLLTAQGTPCLLAGDEFFNSQKGNNNVYCQDNEIGWTDWSRLKTDDSLFRFVRELIAFRKKHPVLHRREELKGLDRTACGMPDVSYHGENAWQVKAEVWSRQLGVLYSGSDLGDADCFVAYNMHWIPHRFALPSPGKGKVWKIAGGTGRGMGEPLSEPEEQSEVELTERSIAVLVSSRIPDSKEAGKEPGKKELPEQNERKAAGKETEQGKS